MIFLFGNHIADFFTSIPELQAKVTEVLNFYGVYHLLDGNKAVSCGAMRGLSMQGHAALVSIVAYYGFGLPLAYLFAFKMSFQVRGLWMGQFCGAAFHCTAVLFLVYRYYDWKRIGKETHARIEEDQKIMHLIETAERAQEMQDIKATKFLEA